MFTLSSIPIQLNLIRFFFQLQPSGRSSSESSDESDKWLPIFVAVTEREFRIYESAPWSVEAWSRPLESYALATTRLAGAGNNSSLNVSRGSMNQEIFTICINHSPPAPAPPSSPVQGQQTTVFCVRCGTARGVLVYWLRSETHRDMAAWARALVQGSHQAVNLQREFSFRCLYQGRQCQLVVHINRGFFLYDCGGFASSTPTPTALAAATGNSTKTQLWQFAFDKLKGSADDGARILYLDFGDDGEIVSDHIMQLLLPPAHALSLSLPLFLLSFRRNWTWSAVPSRWYLWCTIVSRPRCIILPRPGRNTLRQR